MCIGEDAEVITANATPAKTPMSKAGKASTAMCLLGTVSTDRYVHANTSITNSLEKIG